MTYGPKPKISICHPDRKHMAHGLCKACYAKELLRKKRETETAACHPDRPYYRNNKCHECYLEFKNKYETEAVKQSRREYNRTHSKEMRAASEKYNRTHSEKRKQYLKSNAAQNRANRARRRAKEKKCILHATGAEREWRAILFGYQCAYCGNAYESMDHVIAINSGGENHMGNLIPTCGRCNSSKGKKDWRTWYRDQSFYDKKREKFIVENIW